MQPTAEQHSAIHIHDKNLIVVAGAGSGKTRVLVERYLQLLANNPDWKLNALVAITFTREAAFEMRNRVRIALEDNVATAQTDDDVSRWSQLLSEMDTARIDTIHGLCVTILRANAAQAGIDPKFEVLDEVSATILLEEVVSDVLEDLKPPQTQLFSNYESSKIKSSLTRADLINAELETLPQDPKDIVREWQAQWQENFHSEVARFLNHPDVQSALDWQPLEGYPADDKLGQIYLDVHQCVDDLRNAPTLECLIEIADRIKLNVGSAKSWGDKETVATAKLLLGSIRDSAKLSIEYIGEPLSEVDELSARFLRLWYELLAIVRDTYRQRKRDNSQLDFDDLERITAKLLINDAVRARYRNAEYKHLLVDEFQDTNRAQWNIVQALADLETGGSLFVVGDPKQSIYQFRGADVSVFNHVRGQIANTLVGQEIPLSRSFRTHTRLIRQFNALFARILVRDETSPVRDFEVILDQEMTAQREESPSISVLECILLDNNELGSDGEYQKGDGNRRVRIPAEEMRQWEATELVQHINNIIESERPVFDKSLGEYRKPNYGDFAILFQSMTNVNIYEDVFKASNIPFLTVAGRGYYSRQEVWDMLDLLRTLHNPADNLSLATILRSSMFGFSDDLLFALRMISENEESNHPMLLWDALFYATENPVIGVEAEDIPIISFAVNCLQSLRQIAGRVTISELLHQALAKTGYLAILTGLPDGARRRGNIEKLIQLAESSGKITLGKFSQYLADLTARELREGEALLDAQGAVKLMTVHASKGLEFPIVILVDASWDGGSGGGADTLMVDDNRWLTCQIFDENQNKYISGFAHKRAHQLQKLKEDAERKRLLYVAATRAQDYLIISGQTTQGSRDNRWTGRGWLSHLMPALEIETTERAADQTIPFADDEIRVMMPVRRLDNERSNSRSFSQDLWGYEADTRDFPPMQPPLIRTIQAEPTAQIGHIAATQLADLGGIKFSEDPIQREYFLQRFRRRTLHDIPARIQDLSAEQKPKVSQSVVGEIVHETIRYGRFDLPQDKFLQMLEGYAWQKGLTHRDQLDEAIQRSRSLLNRFRESKVYQWMNSARQDNRPIFTELPFILRTEKRVIHGVIDLLFQQSDGGWVVVDYKTSRVLDEDFENHAKRYYLQVGVYAAAVQQQLGIDTIPETYIHYIRESRTVFVETSAWQHELGLLEQYIGDLVMTND